MKHQFALAAQEAGRFTEIVAVPCKSRAGISKKDAPDELHTKDEGIRANSSLESLGKLKPILKNGVMTAGAASQLCDGAAAMLICNERGLKKLGVQPRAKIVSLGLAGTDPIIALDGPIPATRQVLQKAGLAIDDIDLIEVNEAFSSVPLGWAKVFTGGDLSKVNVNGGAIARGHPMGATGAMLMSNLVGELERRKGRYGLLTMCESGGTANATIIERVDALAAYQPAPSTPPHMTMGRALQAVAAWKGDAPALTLAAPGSTMYTQQLSFRELDEGSNRLARAYMALGVERNHLVALCLPSGPDVIVAAFACWKLGATPVNVGGRLPFSERDALVRLANPKLVIGVPSLGDPSMPCHEGFTCIPEGYVPGPLMSAAPLPDVYSSSWLVATSGRWWMMLVLLLPCV
jgi:hypothetical protein